MRIRSSVGPFGKAEARDILYQDAPRSLMSPPEHCRHCRNSEIIFSGHLLAASILGAERH